MAGHVQHPTRIGLCLSILHSLRRQHSPDLWRVQQLLLPNSCKQLGVFGRSQRGAARWRTQPTEEARQQALCGQYNSVCSRGHWGSMLPWLVVSESLAKGRGGRVGAAMTALLMERRIC